MAEISKMAFGDFFQLKIIVFSRLLIFVELIFGLIGLFLVLVILKMYSSFLDHPNMKPHIIFFVQNDIFSYFS
jgi:hypothetical protein